MMNLPNNDNNNTSAYVKSMDEEEDIMQRAMEEKRDELREALVEDIEEYINRKMFEAGITH